MPFYDYECKKCSTKEELFLSIKKSEENQICKSCGNSMVKKISPVPIHYKCGGFYCTDYKD